jgi:hypothetical protein
MTTEEQKANDLLDNSDVPVDVSKPIFTGSITGTLHDVKPWADDEGGVALILTWLSDADLMDTNDRQHPPGTQITDWLRVIPGANANSAADQQRIALENAMKIAKTAGKFTGFSISPKQAKAALLESKGVKMALNLSVSKKGYQQVKYARP